MIQEISNVNTSQILFFKKTIDSKETKLTRKRKAQVKYRVFDVKIELRKTKSCTKRES